MAAYTQDCDETVEASDDVTLLNPALAVADTVRSQISMMLRLLRRPLRFVTFDLPPHFAHLEPLDVVYCKHELLPEGPTGYGTWELVPLVVVEVADPLAEAKITLKCIDLREVWAAWWSPLQTEVGMTADLNGIAILDRAGGWETTRAQVGYGIRPPGDDAYQEVLANTPIIDAFGLLLEGGEETNHLLNSTFSEGSGDTFTSWTKTTTGSAIAVQWQLYTLIDANGFRRATQLATYATGEQSYFSQTVNNLENKDFYLKVYYKDGGAVDRMNYRIQRSDTSEYWRNSDGTWQGSAQDNALTPASGVIETLRHSSKRISTTSGGTVNLTVRVGHFSAAYNAAQISQIQGVELIECPNDGDYYAYRSPLPTKAAAVTRVVNYTAIVNDLAVRVLSPTRGFIKMTVVPHWTHAGISDSRTKTFLSADFDGATNTSWFRLFYTRIDASTGQWRFESWGGGAGVLEVTGGDVAQQDQAYTIIARWTSEAQDEHGLEGQAYDIWVDGVRGTTATGQPTQTAEAVGFVYLGGSPNLGEGDFADAHIRNVTIDDRCPSEAELLRM